MKFDGPVWAVPLFWSEALAVSGSLYLSTAGKQWDHLKGPKGCEQKVEVSGDGQLRGSALIS